MYREVIIKQPHVFKISCLTNIKELFLPSNPPFYAGFGNRETDAIAYRAVAVDLGKIFIINKKSEIKQFNNMFVKSYPELD